MDESVARCMLIAKVLAADGVITDEERELLEAAMEAAQLEESDRRRVRDLEGWEEAEPIVAALDLDDKRAFMDELVHAALADGKVSPHEMEAIERLSVALGLK